MQKGKVNWFPNTETRRTSVCNVIDKKSDFKQQKIGGTEKQHISNKAVGRNKLLTQVLEVCDGEFLQQSLTMLKALTEKVGNMEDQVRKFSRDGNCNKENVKYEKTGFWQVQQWLVTAEDKE